MIKRVLTAGATARKEVDGYISADGFHKIVFMIDGLGRYITSKENLLNRSLPQAIRDKLAACSEIDYVAPDIIL